MGKQIVIDSIEPRKATNGKDFIVVTSTTGESWNVFEDNPDYGKFINGRGAILAIETAKKGDYENITKATLIGMTALPMKLTPAEQQANSYAISYAKDLVINGIIQLDELEKYAALIHRFIATHSITAMTSPRMGKEA